MRRRFSAFTNNDTLIYNSTAITMITATSIIVITDIIETAVMTIPKYIHTYCDKIREEN